MAAIGHLNKFRSKILEPPDQPRGASVNFPKNLGQVSRVDMDQNAGRKHQIEPTIPKGNLESRSLQNIHAVSTPFRRLDCVLLKFQAIKLRKSHLAQTKQLIAHI